MPEDVAEFLRPYIAAGCSAFNVIPCAGDDESAIAAVGELRALLAAIGGNDDGGVSTSPHAGSVTHRASVPNSAAWPGVSP